MYGRRILLIGAGAALIAAVAVWWFVLRSDAPDPVSLEEAVAAVTGEPESDETSTTKPSETSTTEVTPEVSVDGIWATQSGSFAGYRVEEELARIGFTTAAGRTGDVEATLVIVDGIVTEMSIVVDMQTLTSDDDRRDRAIRNKALETNAFPVGSFTLAESIELPTVATDGQPFAATAVGALELHGVKNRIELVIEAQFVDGVIVVVGSAPILFEDYDIAPPTSPALLSVDDAGEMEFQLLFGPAD